MHRHRHIPKALNCEDWELTDDEKSRFRKLARRGYMFPEGLNFWFGCIDAWVGPKNGCRIAEEVRCELKCDATVSWIHYRETLGLKYWIHLDPVEVLTYLAAQEQHRTLVWLDRYRPQQQVLEVRVRAAWPIRLRLALQRGLAASPG